jgi:hypothetical protein
MRIVTLCSVLTFLFTAAGAASAAAGTDSGAARLPDARRTPGPAALARGCATEAPSRAEAESIERETRALVREAERRFADAHRGLLPVVTSVANPTTVRVNFHIVIDFVTKTIGDVPESAIDAQLAVLNAAFVNRGYTFVKNSVDRRIDPCHLWFYNGNGTAERCKEKWLTDPANNPDAVLNFFIADPRDSNGNQIYGHGAFPWDLPGARLHDGVVIFYRTLPGIDPDLVRVNEGDIAVHEVGHWLGLYHTFENGCVPPGDYVDDTPYQDDIPNIYTECTDTDSCPQQPGRDPKDNYMGYTPDSCMTRFTPGQVTRMVEHELAYRRYLNSPGLSIAKVVKKISGGYTTSIVWKALTSQTVDIYRNGAKVVSATPNDDGQTLGTGTGTFTYQVCAAGNPNVCTNTVTHTVDSTSGGDPGGAL